MQNFLQNIRDLITELNRLSNARFYFITTILVIITVGIIYKDDVSFLLDKVKYQDIEQLNRCKDINGLRSYMNNIKQKNKLIDSYNVYIYQPKNKAIYKQVVVYSELNVQGEIYLKDQPELTMTLSKNEYIIYSADEQTELTNTIRSMGSKYLLVYKLESNNKIYGEIHIAMNEYPLNENRSNLLKELRTVLFKFVI